MDNPIHEIAKRYGLPNQLDQLIEENAELIVAARKYNRYRKNMHPAIRNNMIEEIADVSIMLEQIIFLMDCEEEVVDEINRKVNRQLKRMSDSSRQ